DYFCAIGHSSGNYIF
nr:immunoglobulin light chain junction region [Macaca mulatta]MOV69740.1 immunoglobulin light chain junction region [Macaca mulatta]MOX14266.1 immunoglobulin light chain junction region [Macaca mulatta]MOX34199.1 immunoglobulin light chain junction region [Macaca mulatta]